METEEIFTFLLVCSGFRKTTLIFDFWHRFWSLIPILISASPLEYYVALVILAYENSPLRFFFSDTLIGFQGTDPWPSEHTMSSHPLQTPATRFAHSNPDNSNADDPQGFLRPSSTFGDVGDVEGTVSVGTEQLNAR